MGEQIDLYLASQNIGALWFGIAKEADQNDLKYIIMIAIAGMEETDFRKDMFKSKRKELKEIWKGESIEGVSDIVRFSPSACNSQPWIVENTGEELIITRYHEEGKRGIMPKNKVGYYNRIDMGIFLFILETCLKQNGYSFDRELYEDDGDPERELTLYAKYRYKKDQ